MGFKLREENMKLETDLQLFIIKKKWEKNVIFYDEIILFAHQHLCCMGICHTNTFFVWKSEMEKKMLCRQNIEKTTDALQMREKDGEKVKYEKDILSTNNFLWMFRI